jgi:hypothetical protein
MPYKINYEQEQDYITVTIEGDLVPSMHKDIASGVAKMVTKHGCRCILSDFRRANLPAGTLDIYSMPQAANSIGIEAWYKRALLVNEISSNFYFLETVFLNQGHNVKMFTDFEEALGWLLD